MKCNETRHYKMYKAGKRILYASISMMAMGSWMFLNQDAYADVNSNVSATVQATAKKGTNLNQVSPENTANSADSGNNAQTQGGNNSADQVSPKGADAADPSVNTQTPTQTKTPTVGGNEGSATGDATAKTGGTVQPQFTYKVDATSATPEEANGAQGHVNGTGNAAENVTTKAPTSLKTIDQLNGQYIDDKGDISATKPAPATGGGQTASTANMSTDVTGSLTHQYTAGDGTVYYTSDDGNFSGQGGKNDSSKHVVIATQGKNHDDYGKVYYDNGKQWVKLASDDTAVAASYSFKNQIDTTSPFKIQGEWYMAKNDPGGGIGIILQPVNPQLAGIGSSSNAAIDIGIQGQKSTTFLGFDGYQSTDAGDDDSAPGTLTIRQTTATGAMNAAGHGGFNNLTLDTKNSINAKSLYQDTPDATIAGQSNGSQLDVLFDVDWTPDSSTEDADNNVSGTLSVAAYDAADSAMTKPLGKVTVDQVKLPGATSIALFSALGGSGSNVLSRGRITLYKLQQVSQKVTVNYVDIDSGATVKPQTLINADVGNTLDVEETTSGTSASYGAPDIGGYTFMGAVGTDATGNYQKTTMDVVNTSTLADGAKGTYNTLNVYYRKTNASAATRTVASYTLPDGTSVPAVSQASVGQTAPAIKAGTTTPITDAKGNPIELSATLSAVPIQQEDGYISGYTTTGGTWKAATAIPASDGSDAGTTYTVQYESTSPKLADTTIPAGATPQIGLATSGNTIAPTVTLDRDDVTVTQDGKTITGSYSNLIAGKYDINLTASGQAKVVTAYGVDASKLNFGNSAARLMVGTTTLPVQKDADGGTTQVTINTKTKNVIMVDKTWSDGDASHVEINTTDNTASLTETTKGGSPVGPTDAPMNKAVTIGATTLTYHGTDKNFDLTHKNAKATTSDNQQKVTIGSDGQITYLNQGTFDEGAAAGKADYTAGKTEQTNTQLTAAKNSTDYISGYQQGFESTKGTHDGTALGETGATVPGDVQKQTQIYQTAYNTAFTAASNDYKSGYANGGNDVTANKAKTDTSSQTIAYQNGYNAGYDTNAGTVAGSADGSAGKAATDNGTKSQTYQTAYTTAYDTAKDIHDGTQAGTSDGTTGKQAANNSKQTSNYQTAYTTAYNTGAKEYQTGYTTGVAGQSGSSTDKTAGYTNGYNDGQKSYKADYRTGQGAGETDGKANTEKPITGQSAGYQAGYAAG
ncbi:KxYKxGKxW signal peptide domain-containing protein, partial [Secundilactobacillus silagei]